MKLYIYREKIKIESIFEYSYLFILGLFFLRAFCDATLFVIPWPRYYDNLIRLLAITTLLLKAGYDKKRITKDWLICICICVTFGLSWISTGYGFLLDVAILFAGAVDVPYKKILKIYIWCGISIMILAALGSFVGCIEDLLYIGDTGHLKHSFGIVYSTDFAAHIVYLVLAVWLVYEGIPSLVMAFGAIFAAWIVYYYSGARCSTIVLMLLVVGILYERCSIPLEKKNNLFHKTVLALDRLLTILMPLCAILMIGLMFFYSPDNLITDKINRLLSARLRLAQEALHTYGIKAFGTAFDMIGAGGNTVWHDGYNFVDSSYCMILLRYGFIVLLSVCVLYIISAMKARKIGNRKYLIVLSLIAIHNMIEHHLLELAYNVFILLAFTNMTKQSDEENLVVNWKQNAKRNLMFATIGGVGLLTFPILINYARTLVTLLRLYEPERNLYFIIAIGSIMISLCLFLQFVSSLCNRTVLSKQANYRKILVSIVCGGFWVCVFLLSNKVIERKASLYTDTLSQGEAVIAKLESDGFSGKIYVDDIPTLYSKKTNILSNSIFSGESLYSKKNVVLITDKKKELYRLSQAGFLFGELSEHEGIYTNSAEAAESIKSLGVNIDDFYSVKKDVDLPMLANANGLQLTEAGGLLVEGERKSLIHGPWTTIFRGKLRVEFQLKLNGSSVESGALAKVRVSSGSGRTIYTEKELDREDFNEQGECNYTVEFDIGNVDGVEFLLFANKDTSIDVQKITYGKVKKEQ